MRRKIIAATALAAITMSAGLAANAAATTAGSQVDQSQADVSNTRDSLASQFHGFTASQTFTAGTTGMLTDVVLPLWNETGWGTAGDAVVSINPVSSGDTPDTGTVLASGSVTVASLAQSFGTPGDVDFALSTPTLLVAGTKYAITLSQTNGTHEHLWWAGSSGDTYAGGAPSATYSPSGDFGFSTYMTSLASGSHARVGYCRGGTFLDLIDGQPDGDASYSGATYAHVVQGLGLTCSVPAGFVKNQNADVAPFDFYAPA